MFITPHFTLAEMTASSTAALAGLDNTPPPAALANLGLLCGVLEQVRSLLQVPLTITSGFRSQALNQKVGGTAQSAHVLGLAADFTALNIPARQVAIRIRDSDIMFDQLILEFDSWVHLAVSTEHPRRQVLTIQRGGGYLPGVH
ncbi:peptidase M15 [Pseudomonas plecoglossicida]|uniref:D-Ala-D-Ala carboxypeptidase family metallohydrolase n=1 Tax=Pseudomonas plecoglossicida TaxID=70775 RepID=UPI0015E36F20|nr:D-Ala-D-Ala carboxypeptidase family metallohydrolase [Pseudomonas plecoglossicida]MBA1196103.1 peptidase M15 [Pseudomonas plecoglossicida]